MFYICMPDNFNTVYMLQLKDVVHENLNVFVGACVDPPNLCLLWHYCSKGSLNVSNTARMCVGYGAYPPYPTHILASLISTDYIEICLHLDTI